MMTNRRERRHAASAAGPSSSNLLLVPALVAAAAVAVWYAWPSTAVKFAAETEERPAAAAALVDAKQADQPVKAAAVLADAKQSDQPVKAAAVRADERISAAAAATVTKGAPRADPSCSDDNPSCKSWAATGECESNPGFMLLKCASSCNACDRVTRCQWAEDDAAPLGVPAGTHAGFAERALAPELSGIVLSHEPLVLQLDSFLTPAEAALVASVAGGLGYTPSEILQKGTKSAGEQMEYRRSAHRDSQTVFCDDACYAHAAVATMLERAQRLCLMPREHSEVQFLRYDPGQYYRTHHDYLGGSENMLAGPRTLTLLAYLSDVEEGGETVFPALNLSVAPRAGRAVLFSNTLDAEPLQKDVRTRHAALPVRKGVKLAANLWYYHRDFFRARQMGCLGG